MAADNGAEFYPEPFPKGLPIIELQKISLAKLLDDDEEEANKVFEICTHEGFFYLDLTTNSKGLKLLDDAHQVHRAGMRFFKDTPMKDKYTFRPRASYETGLLDTG